MKATRDCKPENKYKIQKITEGRLKVTLFDLSSIQEVEKESETGSYLQFEYDVYFINIQNRENIENYIEENYDELMEKAKAEEINMLASEIREKRNCLLDNTDKEFQLDRLSFDLPITVTEENILETVQKVCNIFNDIKTSEMAIYRQKLRDLTEQDKFPQEVVFPTIEGK